MNRIFHPITQHRGADSPGAYFFAFKQLARVRVRPISSPVGVNEIL